MLRNPRFERKRVVKKFTKPSMTEQHHKKECDVNHILDKYRRTQLITHTNRVQGQYGDFSSVTDYKSALDSVLYADQQFMDLPAKIRERFHNNPALLLEFVEDPRNYGEAAKLGLLSPDKKESYLKNKHRAEKEALKTTTTNKTTTTKKEPSKSSDN